VISLESVLRLFLGCDNNDVVFSFWSVPRLLPGNNEVVFFLVRSDAVTGVGGSPLLFAFRKTPRKQQYIGQVNSNCKKIKLVLGALPPGLKQSGREAEIQRVFLTLQSPWRLDGLRAGQSGLDSLQAQVVSLLHNAQTGSGARAASYPMSTGGSCSGG
jgi:hypothetical protein